MKIFPFKKLTSLILQNILLTNIFCIFISFPTIALADDIKWSKQQLDILKTLLIDSTKAEKDPSNAVVDNPLAIELGHKVFFDSRFSANGKISCASCHKPERFFSDNLDTGEGIKKLNRNTPTIVGASRNTWFFHDGRNDNLWSQALGPLENEKEHDGNRSQYAHLIYSDIDLKKTYEETFGLMPNISDIKRFPKNAGPVKDKAVANAWKAMSQQDQKIITDIFVNIGKSIAAYETQLQPAASRFDLYVKSLLKNNNDENNHLTEDETKGLQLFIGKGRCTTCHSGSMLTDKGFHNISVQPRVEGKFDWGRYTGAKEIIKSPFNCRSEYNDTPSNNREQQCDELKYMIMNRHETFGAMKTPSLRNVSRTAPYMHAGQYKTLQEVLEHYVDPPPLTNRRSELFKDINLSDEEMRQLEAFLHTLDSKIDADKTLLVKPN